MTEKIVTCEICEHAHHIMRDHCPVCGAKRVWLASHSFEPQHTRCSYRSASTNMRAELVRAFRSDLAFTFITR